MAAREGEDRGTARPRGDVEAAMDDPLLQMPPPRHTFRRRVSFAVPVVLVAALAAPGCRDGATTTTNPPPQSTIARVIANPPPAGQGVDPTTP